VLVVVRAPRVEPTVRAHLTRGGVLAPSVFGTLNKSRSGFPLGLFYSPGSPHQSRVSASLSIEA